MHFTHWLAIHIVSQAYEERRRKRDEEREAQQLAEEQEQARREAERQAAEDAEAAKWLGQISTEREGTDALDSEEQQVDPPDPVTDSDLESTRREHVELYTSSAYISSLERVLVGFGLTNIGLLNFLGEFEQAICKMAGRVISVVLKIFVVMHLLLGRPLISTSSLPNVAETESAIHCTGC